MKGALLSTPLTDLAPVKSMCSLRIITSVVRAAGAGESINENERVSGLAPTVNGPVTQEAIDTVREAAPILASANRPPDPTPPESQHGQTSSGKPTISQPIIC